MGKATLRTTDGYHLRLGVSIAFCALVGCRTAAKSDPMVAMEKDSPFATASYEASSKLPVSTSIKFVDKPDLQVGTGPMDAGPVPEFSTTDSGLKYRVLRKSSGRKPTVTDTVTVKYRGWLNNGKVFDSSYERGEPTTFSLGKVIAGWTEGMQLVGAGGMIELWVPSRLGYGERGSPGSIPAHATLHFIVELVDVQ
ncbi:MAG: FKBP-type peptidyl-prolyl cis-trans isomerase [Planctomycetota bacterium]